MNKTDTLKGFILATAAAGIFAGAGFVNAADTAPNADALAAAAAAKKIHCDGVNSCRGRGDCKGENGCKGKNSCKGKGFLSLTTEDCDLAKVALEMQEMDALDAALIRD